MINGQDLNLLKISTAKVWVGETELELRTGNLVQHKALMEQMSKLDLQPLVEKVSPVFANATSSTFVSTLVEAAPAIWREVTRFLGGESADAVMALAGILLDNEKNLKRVYPDQKRPDPERSGGRYIRCEELREWVAQEITLRQLVHVIVQAYTVNGYDTLGNLLRRLLDEAPESGAITIEPETDPETLTTA